MSNSKPLAHPGDTGPDTSPAPEIEGMQTSGDIPTNQGARYTVGDELRMRREELGHNISDVVDAVRIQKRYLEALEEGRNGDLPGTVYALGFVRTYADFLGLDGANMVARYKEETQTFNVDTSLVLPEPIDEGKAPKLVILLLAVALSAAAYGVWYYLAQKDNGVAEVVSKVPERLAGLIEEERPAAAPLVIAPAAEGAPPLVIAPAAETAPPTVTTPPDEAVAQSEPAPPTVTTTPAEAAAQSEPAPPAVIAAPIETNSPPEPETVEPAPPPVAETPVAPPQPETDTEVVSATPAPPPQITPQAEVAAITDEPPLIEEESLPPLAFPPALVPGAEEPPSAPLDVATRDPRVYGLTNTNVRIVIYALEDSWVEVTDVEGVLLFSRVLRKGDAYRVANQQGATFVTGNAGGLELRVDGQVTPSIGPAGVVRRNVRLEPDLLIAGTAVP